MAVDPLAAHVRDELGLSEELLARPVQAAVVSATSFAVGRAAAADGGARPVSGRIPAVAGAALVVLAVLGGWVGGRLGGASPWRVLAGGGLAMAATAVIGRLVGAVGL